MRLPFLLGLLFTAACGAPQASPPSNTSEVAPAVDAAPSPPDLPAASASSVHVAESGTDVSTVDGGVPSTESMPQDDCGAPAEAFRKRVRDGIDACYREGKKTNANLSGRLRILIPVDPAGKPTKIHGESLALGKKVVACMVAVVKKEPFFEPACKSKTVTIARTYGE